MIRDFEELSFIAENGPIEVERVHLPEKGISIEGKFELPPLAKLSQDDQVFVAAFVKCHGSIKEMERYFGLSYPTIKNRLKKLAQALDFVEISESIDEDDVLSRLERGEISVDEALGELK